MTARDGHVPPFKRLAPLILGVRFVGFWAALVLGAWLIGWMPLPTWAAWLLAAPAAFTLSYAVLASIAQHRTRVGREHAGPFWLAVVGVLAFWVAVVVGLVWWTS